MTILPPPTKTLDKQPATIHDMTRQRSSRSSSRPGTRPTAARGTPAKPPGKLRIIGGDYRRRQLPVLDRPGLRPTPDRVRETLFNWLGQALYGQRVLDLFAGTGALGIEALSRGAAQVDFVERDSSVAAYITQNLATLGAARGQVAPRDALAFLEQGASPYDLVFLDPPFHQALAEPCCNALEAKGWLAPDAMIYLETERSLTPRVPANWQLHRETQAGESTARLYRRQTP
ncbi:16S rRNA m(2)G-966 methyltransferase [Vreelandella songnenensis]|uniref:Ribosomal RNA small subunit methyltransferase D n=2 Tax=Vreelandella songnenensis TaxID=1176243 RepID=A0A2T0UZ33_9GAMM|nr:16S rRNA m(2)G-966 methyltransferase [Halomonas songnenensis]